MKPKSNYTRVMAGFYIFLCLIASLILGEIIYFVAIVPLISNHIWLPFINIIWIYIVAVRRACRAGGPYSGKPFHPEDRKSQSGALLHLGSHLQRTELPARRHTGIPGGRRVILY